MQNLLRALVFGLLIGLLAACSIDPASTGTTQTAALQDDPGKGIVCTDDVPVGTSLRKRRCTTPEQREADRRQAERLLIDPAIGGRRPGGM